MLEVLPKIAKMQASYALGKPLALPMTTSIGAVAASMPRSAGMAPRSIFLPAVARLM